MKTGVVDFKTAGSFSGPAAYVSVVLIVFGLMIFTTTWIGSIVIIFFGIIGVTTHQRLMVDFDKKVYHYYVSVLGLRIGDKGNFETIEYIFIKTNRVFETKGYRGGYQVISSAIQFDAYLRFSENEKVHLARMKKRKRVIKFVSPIAEMLNLEIVDYTPEGIY